MPDAATLRAEVAKADADARHHKRAARSHREAARAAAAKREAAKAELARLGIGLVEAT